MFTQNQLVIIYFLKKWYIFAAFASFTYISGLIYTLSGNSACYTDPSSIDCAYKYAMQVLCIYIIGLVGFLAYTVRTIPKTIKYFFPIILFVIFCITLTYYLLFFISTNSSINTSLVVMTFLFIFYTIFMLRDDSWTKKKTELTIIAGFVIVTTLLLSVYLLYVGRMKYSSLYWINLVLVGAGGFIGHSTNIMNALTYFFILAVSNVFIVNYLVE